MGSNTRRIIGFGTIIGIVGFTAYAMYKYRQDKKAEEGVISLSEARAEVEARRHAQAEELIEEIGELDMDEIVDDIRDVASYNRSFMPDRSLSEEREDEMMMVTEGLDFNIPLAQTMTEEDKILRYDPNSIEAKHQFIQMELAEWAPKDDTYHTMLRLFDFPFNPTNDGDEHLRTRLIDYRVRFFGFNSKWVKKITVADVLLHYARSASYNCDESVRYWVEYFLEFNELHHTIPSHEVDEVLHDLNGHVYFNRETETFGLFGLTRDCMDNALKIASRNIDTSMTYEIEFNEFLKTCL